jgi:curli biogenesis system outer membrane secretion channel CsgG
MQYSRRLLGYVMAGALVTAGGCEMLNIGTKTSDSDAKMGLPPYTGIKHAIGCLDFKNDSGWHGEWEIGNNLSIMLESALFDSGRFVVVERENLKDVIAEQDLSSSGRAAPSKKVAQTGLIRPARYLASGAVTVCESSQAGTGGGISFMGVSLGGSKGTAQITIIAKLIDSTTGEIVAKKSITGKAGSVSGRVGFNYRGLSTDLGGFQKTPLGEAAQDCINQAGLFFAVSMEKMPAEGSVADVMEDGQVIINRGSKYGIASGARFDIAEEGRPIVDPDSGEVLDYTKGKVLGELEVTTVRDKVSYCKMVGGATPKKGAVVTPK